MSRPLTQLLPPPDLPPGAASPQFGPGNPTGSGPQGGHMTSMTSLKSLLQLPIKADQRPAKDCCEMKDKDKPLDSDEDSMGVGASGPGGVGGAGAGAGSLRTGSQSAFLGPLLWERTLPVDGGLFQLQYMDLEEFLTENGMGMHSNASSTSAQIPSQSSQSAVPNQSSQCPPTSPPPCSSSSSSMSSSSSSSSLLGLETVQPPPQPPPPQQQQQQSMMGGAECVHGE
uniref:D site albumin promoter binding protein a n=2 Tax=Sphaeramia orbicularis TaxID=375764 RepID=A0A673B1Y1_9TELE